MASCQPTALATTIIRRLVMLSGLKAVGGFRSQTGLGRARLGWPPRQSVPLPYHISTDALLHIERKRRKRIWRITSRRRIVLSCMLFDATLLKGLRSSVRKLRLREYGPNSSTFPSRDVAAFHVVKTRWITLRSFDDHAVHRADPRTRAGDRYPPVGLQTRLRTPSAISESSSL